MNKFFKKLKFKLLRWDYEQNMEYYLKKRWLHFQHLYEHWEENKEWNDKHRWDWKGLSTSALLYKMKGGERVLRKMKWYRNRFLQVYKGPKYGTDPFENMPTSDLV